MTLAIGLLAGVLVLAGGLFSMQDAVQAATCAQAPQAGLQVADLRVVQANLAYTLPTKKFDADVATVVSTSPDLVSLNEVYKRTKTELSPAGYSFYRSPRDQFPDDHTGQFLGPAVLWRTDKFTKVNAGTVRVTSPVASDYSNIDFRYASWVTLKALDGSGEISMISTHSMLDPTTSSQARKDMDQHGYEQLAQLASQLQSAGPVILAGDLNTEFPRDGGTGPAWGPMKPMSEVAMTSILSTLGPFPQGWPTHDGGGTIDWIFYSQSTIRPVDEATFPLNSDHKGVVADFTTMPVMSNAPKPKPQPGATSSPSSTTAPAGAPAGRVAAAAATTSTSSTSSAAGGTTTPAPQVPGYTAEQINNATAIVAAGQALKVPSRGIAIALMTAIGESGLVVLDHGDSAGPDSRGLFQQRDSWGTLEQRMDPFTSATLFYQRLLKVDGWQAMTPTAAAHAVQINADPNYYTPFWDKAVALLGALQGGGVADAVYTPAACAGAANAANVTGSGDFTPNTQLAYVGPYDSATLSQRMNTIIAANGTAQIDPFFPSDPQAADGSWFRDCQHFVAVLDGRVASGYASAAEGWAIVTASGAAHPAGGPDGMSPPVGAWLYYGPDHVAVYMGNNVVASTDVWGNGTAKEGPASDLVNGAWHLPYLGWVAPFGQATPTTSSNTRAS